MNEQEVNKIIQIRKRLIECHNSLDGAANASSAMVKQSDVAYEYVQLIKMTDDLLKPYVNFE